MTTQTEAERAEQNALDAVHETLNDVLGTMLDPEHIDAVAPDILAGLRARLGGYLIDPTIIGLTYTNPIEGTEETREVYVLLDDADADNMVVQTSDGVNWTTLAMVVQTSDGVNWTTLE